MFDRNMTQKNKGITFYRHFERAALYLYNSSGGNAEIVDSAGT